MMTSSEIRQQFFDFFRSKAHTIVPSSPIVVKDDPTLMFTNAGMNQFKDLFLGNKRPENKRVANTQKCLRVSGKHNDLEEVGVDTYHHTMFEMLGNWSFGDYFKEEAIAWSWELLTAVYKIDKDRLYVTVFEGDIKEKLPKDDEAIEFWKKWVEEDRIIMGNKKDNFWEMGDTGPCGPCTEIHIDTRTDEERKIMDGKDMVNKDHPQVIEIWNNVFIQYNRKKDGSLEPLPAKHVDTGMGFERLVRVLQNKQSNYDTDVFTGTIAEVEKISNKKYINTDSKQDIAFRVIADHIRAIAFPIADGQLPSNTGAGYVIRRILRRAVRYYFSYLEVKQPLLYKLIPLLTEQFKNVFPELDKQKDFISKVIKEEEDAFLRTVDKGLSMLDKASHDISGEEAFKLYDTFGFPLDLTKLVAAEKGRNVDEEGFKNEMEKQKTRSRKAGVLDTDDWIILNDKDSSKFVGYDSFETESNVLKYRKTKSQGKEAFQVVLDKTPFYAQSGGQVGDKGSLFFDGEEIEVTDTKKDNDLIIHFTEKLPATITGKVIAKVDTAKRNPTQVHHSATHLMHAALRNVLGKHVAQKGSLVNNEYLRFDFSHFTKVTDEELANIEEVVNEKIRKNIPVVIKEMKKEEAMATGAMALFGEKYGDVVRVVIIDPGYSIELCGGTHVGNTGELGIFKIKQETAVGAGVRRIEAVSGKAAEIYINQQFDLIRVIRDSLKNPKELNKSIENLVLENGELKKQLEKFEAQNLISLKKDLLEKVETINGINFIGQIVNVTNADTLKKISFALKNARLPDGQELKDYIVVLAADIDGKANVSVMLDESLAASKNWEAPKIIKEHIAPLIKGGGGGQKTLATAGGLDTSKLNEVIGKVKSLL
ncbi:MAG TPA: alanine--tRNA ligase [Chitinophagaceae bacterium]|nr:alanine--tRNA ligase [Chitinophagaceae bacterium]